jgi:hypothetical protein
MNRPDESPRMKVPNADRAIITRDKLQEYLLNPQHKRGASKAKALLAMGYAADDWQTLENDLRQQHLGEDIMEEEENDYGTSYVIVANLIGPSGDTRLWRSVWQIDIGTDVPG